jgi:hypothetical protein
MNLSQAAAKHFRDVHFGGNWTTTSLKVVTSDVTWQQAVTKLQSFNTIAALVYHSQYYVSALLRVLRGEELAASDAVSFDHPSITSESEWQELLDTYWKNVTEAAALIEQMPESRFWDDFTDPKYGSYYRNIHGIIEHTHYHLGQIVVIKKLLLTQS